jgi:hypothetical protein
MSGYVWGKNGRCISKNDACHEQLGFMSSYSFIDDACKCSSGYTIQNGQCQLEEVKINGFFKIPKVIPTTTVVFDTPTPQIEKTTTSNDVDTKYQFPFKLDSLLKEKDSNENVKILQSAFATDKSLYPEGVISGYYGVLTKNAVEKFQSKYNLSVSGEVDKNTLEKFNQIFGNINENNFSNEEPQGFFETLIKSIQRLFQKK